MRFIPIFSNNAHHNGPGVYDALFNIFHPRAYSDIDLSSLARWLNEREHCYPSKVSVT